MYLYSQVTSRCQNIFSLGKLMNRNFLRKKMRGWGVIRENFEKYRGTFLLFHSWVGGYFQKFRKVSICSIKKVPAPPPPPPTPRFRSNSFGVKQIMHLQWSTGAPAKITTPGPSWPRPKFGNSPGVNPGPGQYIYPRRRPKTMHLPGAQPGIS